MLKSVAVPLGQIYVPVKTRETLDPAKVASLAERIMDKGLEIPIQVRRDKERYVLVAGLHRLEALRALGESAVPAYIVRTPRH